MVRGGGTLDVLKNDKYLLEEYIEQHKAMSTLNPTSVNTVRIYTVLDKLGEPHIISVTLRVGGNGSEVDNFHSGGVSYPVDVESGVIKGAGKDIHGREYLFHPGTETKAVGFEIPRFDQLKEFVFSACKVIPTSRLIAWDVAVTENGFEMVEGNYEGDPGVMQYADRCGHLNILKKYR